MYISKIHKRITTIEDQLRRERSSSKSRRKFLKRLKSSIFHNETERKCRDLSVKRGRPLTINEHFKCVYYDKIALLLG